MVVYVYFERTHQAMDIRMMRDSHNTTAAEAHTGTVYVSSI